MTVGIERSEIIEVCTRGTNRRSRIREVSKRRYCFLVDAIEFMPVKLYVVI